MTRFTLTIEQAIIFVLNSMSLMIGGEIFVPKLPSYNLMQLAQCIDMTAEIKIIGKRPGEKIHEAMISSTDSYKTIIKEIYQRNDKGFNETEVDYFIDIQHILNFDINENLIMTFKDFIKIRKID